MAKAIGSGGRRVEARVRLRPGAELRWGQAVDLVGEGEGGDWWGVGIDVPDDFDGTGTVTLVFARDEDASAFVAGGAVRVEAGCVPVGRATPIPGVEARSARWVGRLLEVLDGATEDGQDTSQLTARVAAERDARARRTLRDPGPASSALAAMLVATGPLRMTEGEAGWKPAAAAALLAARGVAALAGVEGERPLAPDCTFARILSEALFDGTVTLVPTRRGADEARQVLRPALGCEPPADALAPLGEDEAWGLCDAIAGAREGTVRGAALLATRGPGAVEADAGWARGATEGDLAFLEVVGRPS